MAFDGVPVNSAPDVKAHNEWIRKAAVVINRTLQGKINNTGTVTLTANAASTVVSVAYGRIGNDTVILFQPTTANAAAEIGAGGMYISARATTTSPSTFTITHANNAQNDRTFLYTLVG